MSGYDEVRLDVSGEDLSSAISDIVKHFAHSKGECLKDIRVYWAEEGTFNVDDIEITLSYYPGGSQ